MDRIDRIEILTSTRRVNVGDIESLDIQGFDENGNVFSTLQGSVAFRFSLCFSTGFALYRELVPLLRRIYSLCFAFWSCSRFPLCVSPCHAWLKTMFQLCSLAFEWMLNEHVLQRLSFSAARMNASEMHRSLEARGLSTDRLPIRGMAPGKATVTARLKDVV